MKTWFLSFLTLLSGLAWAEMDLQEFCLNKNLNEVVAHPQDCRGYIMCSEQPTAEYCEEGFHFDMKGLVCNWPEKVNCQISRRQTEEVEEFARPALAPLAAYDIMTGQVINEMVDYDPLNVVCRHFGAYFLPSPQNCRSYYLCAYGHMHEHTCGAHTLWDYQLQQCVISHQTACYRSNEAEEQEINTALENVTMVCYPANTNTSNTEIADTTSTEYVTTLTTSTTTTSTPPTPPTITLISSTTHQPAFPNPYNITCPVKRQSYVAHPEDCSKYFMCIMGTAVMTTCPRGLLWDSKKAYCDISKNVKCFREKSVNEEELQAAVI